MSSSGTLAFLNLLRVAGVAGYPPASVPAPPAPAWRSPAGLVVPPPSAPELQTCDDRGFTLNVTCLGRFFPHGPCRESMT